MNSFEIQHGMNVLGWTLLHSLWQGLIIYLLLVALRKLIRTAPPTVKYAISTGALLIQVLASVVTFSLLSANAVPSSSTFSFVIGSLAPTTTTDYSSNAGISQMLNSIPTLFPYLVGGWLIGVVLFGFRLVISWSYTVGLRVQAVSISGFWKERLNQLAVEVGLERTILLAESKRVDAPVLLGYLKPVILLPVGLISGLSSEQVESVLLHELAHIRRHDFAVNIIQSIIEAVWFFNPFVWIISFQIRSDRELCCDDTVVQIKNPLIYAQALRQLAEVQTLGTSFSLGMAGNKNKLLHRIKRIMKTADRNEASRGKVIPALLVIVSLVAVSWLSIQAYLPDRQAYVQEQVVKSRDPLAFVSDTVVKDKEKSTSYSRQSITTRDEKGVPHTEITEWSKGSFDMWVPPAIEVEIAEIPELAVMGELAPAIELEGFRGIEGLDTLVQPDYWVVGPGREQWEKEFTDKFRERFSDFYEKNRPEFEKMIEEVHKNLEELRNIEGPKLAMAMDNLRLNELQIQSREMARQSRIAEGVARGQFQKMSEDLHHQNERLKAMARDQRAMARGLESRIKEFESELTKELIKDGYLGKDEKINSLNLDDGNDIKVNGKKIKDADLPKYRELHNRFFKNGSHIGLPE